MAYLIQVGVLHKHGVVHVDYSVLNHNACACFLNGFLKVDADIGLSINNRE